MITVLTGDASYEVERALGQLIAQAGGEVERIDGSTLELRHLPDLLMGASLFGGERLVVIRGLAENKTIWPDFADWLPRIATEVVLVEGKLDKRTKTYKALKKDATLREFDAWQERDQSKAESWVVHHAKELGIVIDQPAASELVRRTGFDQWALHTALEKIRTFGVVTVELVQKTVDASPSENVFEVLETALRGDSERVLEVLRTLALSEEAFMLFGLLSGQAFQLAAVATSSKSGPDTAKDIGAHPFVVQKLSAHARRLGVAKSLAVLGVFSNADAALKRGDDPWTVVERSLVEVATIAA